MIQKLLFGFAAAFAVLLAPMPASATPSETQSPAPGQVVYAIGYKDRCDGGIEVAIGNATKEDIAVKINGDRVDVPAESIGHWLVEQPDEGKNKVAIKVILGKGRPDKASHTWAKPKVCLEPSPSASATPAPSTPAPTTSAGTVPVSDQLPLTGAGTVMMVVVGASSLVLGVFAVYAGRRRRFQP